MKKKQKPSHKLLLLLLLNINPENYKSNNNIPANLKIQKRPQKKEQQIQKYKLEKAP